MYGLPDAPQKVTIDDVEQLFSYDDSTMVNFVFYLFLTRLQLFTVTFADSERNQILASSQENNLNCFINIRSPKDMPNSTGL